MERGSAEHEAWVKSVDPTYREAAAAAPDAAAEFVTTSRMKSILGGIAKIMVRSIDRKTSALEARIVALEKRLSEPAGSAPGWALDDVSRQLAHLGKTLSQPVRPIYDERGKLVGAVRESE